MIAPDERELLRAALEENGLGGTVLRTILDLAELVGLDGLPAVLASAEMELIDEVLKEWQGTSSTFGPP